MNDNDTILAELKKISAWADMQRKMTKWSLIGVAIFIPILFLSAAYLENRLTKNIDRYTDSSKSEWYDVSRNIQRGDINEAIRIGELLIANTPLYPDGHARLGSAYLAAGNIKKAQEHYSEAVRLFPSEENMALLNAASLRIKQEIPQQAGPAYPPQGVGSADP